MAQDIISLIKQQLKIWDPSLDISDSSAVVDILVNPLSTILAPFDENIKTAFMQLSLQDVTKVSDGMMDARAADFGITRVTGSKATGTVRVYFTSPIDITIPKNSTFSTKDGRLFKNSSEYTFSANTLLSNIERYPLYGTGDITITAVNEGQDNEAFAGEITTVVGMNSPYKIVTNSAPILGGTEREDNTGLKQRILDSFTSLTLNSEDSITKLLRNNYPTLLEVAIKAIGDDEMTRDIYYSGIGVSSYFLSDFYGKVSGLNFYPYNRSRSFYGNFPDDATNSGLTLADIPDIGSFVNEVVDYGNLFKYDSNRLTISVGTILDTSLSNSNSLTSWVKSDGQLGVNTTYASNEIEFDTTTNMTRLGSSVDRKNYLQMSMDDLKAFKLLIHNKLFVQAGEIYDQWQKDILLALSETNLNNQRPIISKQISNHTAIEITGTFMSNDSSDTGEMSYVTVLRNPNIAVPHDGLGFCWRKGDGNTYNVYIVDSDALSEDVFIGTNNIIADGGIGNFLLAGQRIITTDGATKYDFKLRVSSTFGMRLWVVDNGTTMVEAPYNSSTTPGGYLLDRGAQSETYSPNAGSGYTVEERTLLHFGISVINTRNNEWWYNNVKITSIEATIPLNLFQLDAPVANFESGSPFRVFWNGAGKYGADLAPSYGANLYIYNYTQSAWELAGTHTSWVTGLQAAQTITKTFSNIDTYRDANNFVNLIAGTTAFDLNNQILTDYVEIDNIAPSGIHQGNMVDIYVNDPTNIIETTGAVTLSSVISISKTASPTINFPIQEIIQVEDNATQTVLTPGTDYIISYNNPEKAFSNQANITIYVTGYGAGTMNITYRYYSNGESMQTLMNSTTYRSPGVDNLIKVMPPVVVTINVLDYRGGLDVENMKSAISTWINNLTDSLEISDLINFMYTQGVSYIDLTTLDITVRAYDYLGEQTEIGTPVQSSYTLPSLAGFYTNSNEMSGLNKLA